MSFLKYAQNPDITKGNGRGPLSFRKAHVDGMPWRGPTAMLKDEEYDEYTEQVNDGYVALFDLSNPQHLLKLQEIVDAAANAWYSIWKMQEHAVPQPDGSLKIFVYCVWVEPYRELARHRLPSGLTQLPYRMA